MKFALTSPVYMLDWQFKGDFLFVLAQYMKFESYRKFVEDWRKNMDTWALDKRKPIMMDNGAYEGELVSMDELLELAKVVKPDIIIAPDSYRNMDDTIDMTTEFLYSYKGNAEIMVVPQGRDDFEWMKCFWHFISELHFDWLGLPRWLMETPMKRTGIFDKVRVALENRNVRVHLLGLPNPHELKHYHGEEIVKSVDSSWPFTYARWGRMGMYLPPERVNMLCMEVLPKHLIEAGIDYVRSMINDD